MTNMQKEARTLKVSRSRKDIRHDRILGALEANPALRVTQLADELAVSSETIRRDLAELDQLGRISRTYGGAVRSSQFEPALNERMSINVSERRAIAQAAVERYAGADALLLGGGATMLQFARALRLCQQRMTVLTPAYAIAAELAANPLIEVMMLPGIFEPREALVGGSETIRAIARYRAPVAIIGASGLNEDGISEAMLSAGEVYAAMLDHAGEGVILADHSKFEKRALVLLRGWSAGLTLICDSPPPAPLAASIRSNGSTLVIAPPAS